MITYTIDPVRKRVQRFDSSTNEYVYIMDTKGEIEIDMDTHCIYINGACAYEHIKTIFETEMYPSVRVIVGELLWNFKFRLNTNSANYKIISAK